MMKLFSIIMIFGIVIMVGNSESPAVDKYRDKIKTQDSPKIAADVYAYYSDVRLAMREIETLAEAVHDYRDDHGIFPTSLQVLIPDYLDYLPVSPWNTSYDYFIIDTTNYIVQIVLPRTVCSDVTMVKHNADSFENYADCLLTDEEKLWLIYNQLRRIEGGIQTYHVDYNLYPTSLQELLDDHYIEYVPILDPYRHPYDYQLHINGYTLTGFGKDGKQGGTHYSTDTIISIEVPRKTMIFFKDPFGYILIQNQE